MSKFTYVIADEVGIHARPAKLLVDKCKEYKSNITLTCKGKTVNAKGMMGVMGLGAVKGTTVEVSVEGEDEAKAVTELEAYFKANF